MHYFRKIMFNKLLIVSCIFIISGCASVVEPIKIDDLSPNSKLQEQLPIEVMPLTFAAAEELNVQRFPRILSLPGDRFSAKVISDQDIQRNQFPPDADTFSYLLGVGDQISFINQSSSGVTTTTGRIGSDGTLLLIGVGRLEAKGRHINDLRDEVRSILIRNGLTPDFQMEMAGFNSQKAYITTDSPPDEKPDQIKYILPITDRGTPLREIIATAGIAFNEKKFTIVKIQRSGKTYTFSLSDLFSETAPRVFLKDQDHVFIQNLEYVKGKVFLVGGVKPKVLEIQPELRQTLAEIIFAPEGPLEEPSAQRSAVYLLRGHSPVKAYHLDAQNPARILVAGALEMRPGDIVYVAEQPINTFNRVLETILPFRLFSRDTSKGNFP